MSLRTDAQLEQAQEQLLNLYRALEALKSDLAKTDPFAFRVMAEGPMEEIRALREAIAEYTGENVYEQSEADIRLRLKGLCIQWRSAPISVLGSFFRSLRYSLTSLAEAHAVRRPSYLEPLEVKRATDLALVDIQPGSLDLGLKFPAYAKPQTDIFSAAIDNPIACAMRDLLLAAEWASGTDSTDRLAHLIPDLEIRRIALGAVKPIAPRITGFVEEVELYGYTEAKDKIVRLSRESGRRITRAHSSALSDDEVSYTGDLREIDLDKRTFQLRNVPEIRVVGCQFQKIQEDKMSILLGKKVRVVGIQKRHPDGKLAEKMQVHEVAPIDPSADDVRE